MDFHRSSILIVDDARFTCEIIRRSLKNEGYTDIRVCGDAESAIKSHNQRQADIILADWLMPDMDGLELTSNVRQIDEENFHYTYILLLTAKNDSASLIEAFDRGVDDFITKSPNGNELVARVSAGSRIAHLQNTLLDTSKELISRNKILEQQNTYNHLTGIGNRLYVEDQLSKTLEHSKNRGGGICCGVVKITNKNRLLDDISIQQFQEIISSVGTRLKQSVRPLDVIGEIGGGVFVILMYQEDISQFSSVSYKRIHNAINLRTFKTSAGSVSVTAAVSVTTVEGKTNTLSPNEIINRITFNISEAEEFGRVYEATLAS